MSSKSYKKDEWRRRNMIFIRRFVSLWSGHKLSYRYAELSGETGDQMFENELKPYMAPELYTAIDNNIDCMLSMRLKEPSFNLAFGDVYQIALDLAKDKPGLGVLGLDTTNGLNESWWADKFSRLREIIITMGQFCPHPIVILNHDLDRGIEPGKTTTQRLEMHAECLSNTLRTWGLEKSKLLNGMSQASMSGAEGQWGGFDVYRSKPNEISGPQRNRMVTVRLAFDVLNKTTHIYTGE